MFKKPKDKGSASLEAARPIGDSRTRDRLPLERKYSDQNDTMEPTVAESAISRRHGRNVSISRSGRFKAKKGRSVIDDRLFEQNDGKSEKSQSSSIQSRTPPQSHNRTPNGSYRDNPISKHSPINRPIRTIQPTAV